MPIHEGAGLLDGGSSSDSHELPTWQADSWDKTAADKTSSSWLRFLRWPFTVGNSGGSSSNSGGAGVGSGSSGSAAAAAAAPRASRALRPTAYLDGMRGFAAFLVYIHHNELWAHAASTASDDEIFENAYGYKGRYRFAALPVVRNFFTGGHLAVAIFYIISGYVLTAKPLALIQAGEHLRLLDSMASSIFRRWFRLYIPIAATTFVYVTVWHVFGIWTSNCQQAGNLRDEWWNWYVELKNFSFVFKEGSVWMSYNTHLWSIPLEMRGSLIVFLACIALFRTSRLARHLCLGALVVYFLYIVDGYYGALFVMGMLLCDLDLLAARADYPADFPALLRLLEPYRRPLVYAAFAVGMLLAGVPSETNSLERLRANPGWYYLSFLKPQAVFDPKWFYLFVAATLLMVSIPRIAPLRRFFESPFCQYLGRVSYSLYLVHGPVLATLGDRVYTMVGWVRPIEEHMKALEPYINLLPLPRAGPMGLEISFLLPHLVIAPVTFMLANLVTKYVDDPAVRIPAALYKKTLALGAAQPKPEDALRLA